MRFASSMARFFPQLPTMAAPPPPEARSALPTNWQYAVLSGEAGCSDDSVNASTTRRSMAASPREAINNACGHNRAATAWSTAPAASPASSFASISACASPRACPVGAGGGVMVVAAAGSPGASCSNALTSWRSGLAGSLASAAPRLTCRASVCHHANASTQGRPHHTTCTCTMPRYPPGGDHHTTPTPPASSTGTGDRQGARLGWCHHAPPQPP